MGDRYHLVVWGAHRGAHAIRARGRLGKTAAKRSRNRRLHMIYDRGDLYEIHTFNNGSAFSLIRISDGRCVYFQHGDEANTFSDECEAVQRAIETGLLSGASTVADVMGYHYEDAIT